MKNVVRFWIDRDEINVFWIFWATKERAENPEEAKDSLGDIPDPDTPFTIESGSEEEPLEGADANASVTFN